MNTLLEKSDRMTYHTDLRSVFAAIKGRQREFNWLITDLELNTRPPGFPMSDSRDGVLWMTGTALTDIVDAHDLQFIWGVLSGFRPGIELNLAQLDPYPFADGNAELWKPGVRIQHPLAEVEIVCWDSSATLFLTNDESLTGWFREYFPESVDLDEYNRTAARLRDPG